MADDGATLPMADIATVRDSARRAVIDVGSNSVRLVVYEGPPRAPMPIINEKVLCGLGRDMSDGRLKPEAVDYALATLKRFRALLALHGDPSTRVVATAAVREADNGREFVDEIRRLGLEVVTIDGAEEAALAALGVVALEPGATGIVGDMGGVSLELVALRNGEVGERSSLSIGPLRLMQLEKTKISAASDHIADELSRIDWLKARNFDTLYSVGGAWRAIARIHMRLKGHPLPVLHHFEMTSKEAAEVASLVAKQSSRSLGEIEGISTRRVDTLPLAAAAFREVLRRTKVERIIVSAGGLREGLLYSDLSEHERAKDPLFEGVRFLAERLAPDPAVGDAVISLTDGLFPDETPAQLRLRRAACLATDIAAYFQPDLRAMHAFDTALRGPLYGLSHAERVFMALALFCRHEGDMLDDLDKRLLGLMPWDDRRRAIQLGLALRFAGAFAPKAPAAFSGCALAIQGQRLEFRAPERLRGLMGEMPRRRLEALAVSFEATPAEVYY